MKNFALKLIKKHKLKRDKYYKKSPYGQQWGTISEDELKLLANWTPRVAPGWYGISIGNPCPISWFRVLDEFFIEVEKYNPEFQICQVKLKLGGLRIYLDKINKETQEAIYLLEGEMFDNNLIY